MYPQTSDLVYSGDEAIPEELLFLSGRTKEAIFSEGATCLGKKKLANVLVVTLDPWKGRAKNEQSLVLFFKVQDMGQKPSRGGGDSC